MKIRSLAFIGSLLAALAVPAAADAYQSFTASAVNMRAGAGTNHVRIAMLPPGASVWVDYCRRGWCLVSALGLKGWVSARYVGGAGPVYRYEPPAVYVPPAVRFHYDLGRRDFHDYGLGRHHEFKRKIHKKRHHDDGRKWRKRHGGKKGHGGSDKWDRGCPSWKCGH